MENSMEDKVLLRVGTDGDKDINQAAAVVMMLSALTGVEITDSIISSTFARIGIEENQENRDKLLEVIASRS